MPLLRPTPADWQGHTPWEEVTERLALGRAWLNVFCWGSRTRLGGRTWEAVGSAFGDHQVIAAFGATEAEPPKPEGARGPALIRGSHS